ncbi:hypothetical protein [Bradyrhizobium phage BDU-MI-1]|nr:hypothetical protein [Bradyrhizobium phage BDU-MI-1]
MDVEAAERLTDELITAELSKQNAMWGRTNERADISKGQLMHAGMAQLDALHERHLGVEEAFIESPLIYPEDWSGFRDYGSDVANLVVAVAFLTQEIKRKLMAGEDYTRTSRTPDQVYRPETGLPNTIET